MMKSHPENRECPNGPVVGERYHTYRSLCHNSECGYCGPRLAREMAFLIVEANPSHIVLLSLGDRPQTEWVALANKLMKNMVKRESDTACWTRIRGEQAIMLVRGKGVVSALIEATLDLDVHVDFREIPDVSVAAHRALGDLIEGIGRPYEASATAMRQAVELHGGSGRRRGKLALTYGGFWRTRRGRIYKDVPLASAQSWIRSGGKWADVGPASIRWQTPEEDGRRWDGKTRRWTRAASVAR